MGAICSRFVELTMKTQQPARGLSFYNVFQYRSAATIAGAPLKTDFAGAWIALFQVVWQTCMSNEITTADLFVRNFDDGTDLPEQIAFVNPGSVADDMIPSDTAAVIRLNTALRGRAYRGSKHYVGVPEGSTNDNRIEGAGPVADFEALRDAHIANVVVGGNTWNPCVWSKTLTGPVVNATTIVATPVTAAILNLTIGTMRGRRERTVS